MRKVLLSTPIQGYLPRRARRSLVLPLAVALTAALAAGAPLVVGWQLSSALIAPAPFARPDQPERYGLAYQRVEVPSAAGPLKAWLFEHPGSRQKAVLFLHGWRSHKQHMLAPYLRWLAARYTVLAFDHPNHGESPRKGTTTLGVREAEHAASALALLRQKGYTRIALMGTSMGGATAIAAAAADSRVRAVVAEAAFARPEDITLGYFTKRGFWLPELFARTTIGWVALRTGTRPSETSPERLISRLAPRPVLLIHGTADAVVLPDSASRLYQAAGAPKDLWLVQGADHMSEDATSPHALYKAEYERRVTAFLDNSL